MPHEVNVSLLPKPRKSRHPYQWGCMAALLTYAVLNLRLGPASNSPLDLAGGHPQYLNWTLLIGSTACLVAMVVPDNYWRMVVEFVGHSMLVFTMSAYGLISYEMHAQNTRPGVSLNLIFAVWVGVAAIGRCAQIAHTVHRIWFSPASVCTNLDRS